MANDTSSFIDGSRAYMSWHSSLSHAKGSAALPLGLTAGPSPSFELMQAFYPALGSGCWLIQVHDDPRSSPVDGPTQWPLRHLRQLLQELMAIASISQGRQDFAIDLTPVGDTFDPAA